jgi:hypothetical protein
MSHPVPWPVVGPTELIDAPARAALLHARSGTPSAVAPAVLGAGLISVASAAGAAFSGHTSHTSELLRAVAEAVGFAGPVFVLAVASANPKLSPPSVLSLLAVALGVAGLSAVLVLPLLAFLWLCSDGAQGFAPVARLVAAPATFLLATGLVLVRGLKAMGAPSAWSAVGFVWLAVAAFVLRAGPMLRGAL